MEIVSGRGSDFNDEGHFCRLGSPRHSSLTSNIQIPIDEATRSLMDAKSINLRAKIFLLNSCPVASRLNNEPTLPTADDEHVVINSAPSTRIISSILICYSRPTGPQKNSPIRGAQKWKFMDISLWKILAEKLSRHRIYVCIAGNTKLHCSVT